MPGFSPGGWSGLELTDYIITTVYEQIDNVSVITEGKPGIGWRGYHFVVSTLALGLKINFDQPIKWMEFQKLAEIKWLLVNCKQENIRNTVLHIQAKVHPVTNSISVKFWEIKKNIGISKRTTSHFRISHRYRDICLDCGSFINLSD